MARYVAKNIVGENKLGTYSGFLNMGQPSIAFAYLRVPGREELPVAEMRTQKKDAPALRPAFFHPMESLDLLDPAQG